MKRTNIKQLSDNELIEQYKQSNDSVYAGELYVRYTQFVFLVSMKYLKNTEKSKDAVMQIFEQLLDDLQRFEIQNFKAWLHQVTRNFCLMLLRSESSQQKKEEDMKKNAELFMETEPVLHLSSETGNEAQLQLLETGIETLNEEQKKCIQLFYLQEKSYKEVATETGFPMKKVKSYIQNGKRNLKIFMERNGNSAKSLALLLVLKSLSEYL